MANERQHLLTEYQSCQFHIQTIDMRLWQSAAILMGASFAALAVLAREEASTPYCVGVSLAALGAAAILGLWTLMWKRRDAAVMALEARMREIEWATGMRKIIYFRILRRWRDREQLEDWKLLTVDERTALSASYPALAWPSASLILFFSAMVALAGWPALAAGKLIELAMKG